MDEKKFLALYERQQESGLTVKEFCSNEIIAPATFYYWKKKLIDQNRLPDFIPVIVNSSYATQPRNNNSTIEIEFSNKAILRIDSELDLSVIKALIHLND